jgi:hypothetical protein
MFCFPRLTLLVLWWLCSGFPLAVFHKIGEPYWLWPLLGWVFIPYTTLAFVVATHYYPTMQFPVGWFVVMGLALLMDLGVIGTGKTSIKKRRNRA